MTCRLRVRHQAIGQRLDVRKAPLGHQHLRQAAPPFAIAGNFSDNLTPLFFDSSQIAHVGVNDSQIVAGLKAGDSAVDARKVTILRLFKQTRIRGFGVLEAPEMSARACHRGIATLGRWEKSLARRRGQSWLPQISQAH